MILRYDRCDPARRDGGHCEDGRGLGQVLDVEARVMEVRCGGCGRTWWEGLTVEFLTRVRHPGGQAGRNPW